LFTRRGLLKTLSGVAIYPPLMNAQERASISDEELTTNLLSTPGPTFRIGEAALEQSWTLIAYGDMRFTDPANEKVANPKVRRWLVDRIASEHPDVVLLSGDVPYDGSDTNDYEVFYQETRAWREARLHVYPAMGNHELHGGEVRDPKNWWHEFPELKGRRWYSVAMPHAYVISLDSNLSLLEGSRQQRWLLDQLEHLPEETLFVFLSLHHPPVADSIEGDHSHDVRPNERALVVLLEKEAASSSAKFIVVAGHIHNYERFLESGVTYLVSGGGGAKPHPIARTAADLYKDTGFPNYHYVKFTHDREGLAAQMYRVEAPDAAAAAWEIKDRFAILSPRHR